MAFRINNVKKYQQCPKHFLLDYTDISTGFPFIYFSESLLEAAKKHLHIADEDLFTGTTSQTSADTLAGIENKTWACLARFEKHNFRIKVSFLKKEEDGYIYYALCHSNHHLKTSAVLKKNWKMTSLHFLTILIFL